MDPREADNTSACVEGGDDFVGCQDFVLRLEHPYGNAAVAQP